MQKSITYRPDIDGLRAIAVLAVVLFHLDIPLFSGGYVGVDVFFVISGYLITSIIENKCRQSNFSFTDFYLRRLRRLMPALLVTIAGTYIGAAVLFSPEDLINMARSAIAALFSISNIVFFFEAGYWDSASELKPLLHTWSLGVEEQFYLFWPALVVFLAAAQRRSHLGLSMLLLAIGGSILTIWYTARDPSGAFYLLPFRVNQFALGALVIYVARSDTYLHLQKLEWPRYALGLVGLVLILYSIIVFNGNTVFPGYAVLTPTLGAALLLLSGSGGGQTRHLQRLLANAAAVWLGKLSYSMYLVHWPIIALYRYRYGLDLSSLEKLGLGLATLLLAIAMHYLIETRFYSRQHSLASKARLTDAQFSLRLGLAVVLLVIAPLSAWQGDGWAWRFQGLSLTPEQISAGKRARFDLVRKACRIDSAPQHKACNSDAPAQILVLGDSHEPDGYNFLHALVGDDNNVNLVAFGTINKCMNLRRENDKFLSDDDDCQQRLDALFTSENALHFNSVLYASNQPFGATRAILYQMLKELKALNEELQIITLGGYINTQRPCAFYLNKYRSSAACARAEHVVYFGNEPTVQPLYQSVMSLSDYYIDMVGLLCTDNTSESCLTETEAGVPAFYDRHHKSLEFALMAGRLYKRTYPDFFTDVLGRTAAHKKAAETPLEQQRH